MDLASIALGAGRAKASGGRDVVDIITFIEAPWGLGMSLFPVQRVILKAFYGIPLDDNPYCFALDTPIPTDHPFYHPDLVDVDGFYAHRVEISDWRRETFRVMTEADYLRLLHAEKRCNISEVTPGAERRELVLSVGRRSGKTAVSACIAAYETYRLISKGDPQAYYGLPAANNIQLISFATDKDQAGLLYQEVSGHFRKCAFFAPYTANNTQTYARFQTPTDIQNYGSYQDDQNNAKATIKVTFRSSVAKGSRGAGNIVVVLDEMAHFTDNGQSSAEAVYKAVVPSTATFSPKDPRDRRKSVGPVESKIIAISSPLGKQGVFYDLFQHGFRGGTLGRERLCVQAPTWEVNPTIPAGLFEAEYVKDVRSFLTEFGAEFSDRTRGWLEDGKDLLACVEPMLRPPTRAAPRMPHYMGIDLALKGDGTAIAIGHADERGRIVVDVVDEIKAGEGDYAGMDRLNFEEVADWVHDYTRRFYIVEGMFDQWAGIPFEQALQARGLRQLRTVHHTMQLSSQMYQNFKDMIFDKRVALYDWPLSEDGAHCEYIAELLELQAEYKSKYVTIVAAPNTAGKHDDRSDALARMVWVASQNLGKGAALAQPRNQIAAQAARVAARSMQVARRKAFQTGSAPERMIPKGRGGGGGRSGGAGTGLGGGLSFGRSGLGFGTGRRGR